MNNNTNPLVKLFLVILLTTLHFITHAQEYKDCTTPLSFLCGESPHQLVTTIGAGEEDLDFEGTCLMEERNSLWMQVEIIKEGSLTFVFNPQNPMSDLDFAVFKSESNGCQNMVLTRCMATGMTLGQSDTTQLIRCAGATGLREGEIDFVEAAGCQLDDNNFLAPLDCASGDIYYIVLNDFTILLDTVILTFGGTAELDCITTSTQENQFVNPQVNIFPNPTTGTLFYSLPKSYVGGTLSLINIDGKIIVTKESLTSNEGNILLSDVNSGLYVIRVFDGSEVINISVQVIN